MGETIRALGRFGVYGPPRDDELAVLALADEYRQKLCDLHWRFHRALLNLREQRFPGLFAAIVRREQIKVRVARLESEVKLHHSTVRDRNAVTPEQREKLVILRRDLAQAKREVTSNKRQWITMLREAKALLGDRETRKNTKRLARRLELYGKIHWPAHLDEYGHLWIEFDLERRRLGIIYQKRGLHSAIRGEIEAASKPKLLKDAPGMRYTYSRPPEPQPWQKLILQFVGGLSVQRALEGVPNFCLTPVYTNHHARRPDETVYRVRQQVGNSEHARMIEYTAKLHRPLPEDAVIQRWTLIVDGARRSCVPTLKVPGLARPVGSGTLSYDLRWTVVAGGVLVCKFAGEHVNESLILPDWLVERRMGVRDAQAWTDGRANEFLDRRGIPRSKKPGPNVLFGLAALAAYCQSLGEPAIGGAIPRWRLCTAPTSEPDYTDAQQAWMLLDQLSQGMKRARRVAKQAERAIESIYRTVARRVCSQHAAVGSDHIDLARIKRYGTRDLLREDVLPERSREILFAVAPGKLRALLDGYGLASVEVVPADSVVARETDLFTSYVRSLGQRTGRKYSRKCRRSQHAPERETVDELVKLALTVPAQGLGVHCAQRPNSARAGVGMLRPPL